MPTRHRTSKSGVQLYKLAPSKLLRTSKVPASAVRPLPPLQEEQLEYEVPATQGRMHFREMIERAQTNPALITKHGRPVAAVVSADFYEAAMQALETLQDQRAIEQARQEPEEERVPAGRRRAQR